MATPTRYLTIAGPSRFEPEKTKGSRFVADLAPVSTEAEAEALLEAVRSEFQGASHHCFAWILDPEGLQTRNSDDGEPGGSAGAPIQRQLEGHGVTGLACVVTRWFGGTKLGVGGLIRAYGGAAGQALDRAELREVRVRRHLVLEFPYEASGAIDSVARACEAEAAHADYGEGVRTTFVVPLDRLEEFEREVVERTAGRARVCPP
ncbi:MAG: YigZ family protein [Planctomycetota bacterium]|nr:YigZ family protein [Planctomycetota bacterium]